MVKSKKTSRVAESGRRYKKQQIGARTAAGAGSAPPDRRRSRDEGKLGTLRSEIRAGIEELDRGKFSDVAERDLDAHIERLAAPTRLRNR